MGVGGKLHKINRKENGVRRLPLGELGWEGKQGFLEGALSALPMVWLWIRILSFHHLTDRILSSKTAPLASGLGRQSMLCSVESHSLQSWTWDQPQPQFTQIQLWRSV